MDDHARLECGQPNDNRRRGFDVPGPSRLVREVVNGSVEDFQGDAQNHERTRNQQIGSHLMNREAKQENIYDDQGSPTGSNRVEEEVITDADFGGHQIIQGEDGEYYVVVDDDEADDDASPTHNNFRIVVDNDGTQSIMTTDERSFPKKEVVETESQHSILSQSAREQPENGPMEIVLLNDQDQQQEVEVEDDLIDDDDDDPEGIIIEPLPQGLKSRKNRQYGNCRCPECGASFVNTARLERHLAVHQVFGSYLCPLCGKTYKYEYNLFYHWRKTCRDLNELIPAEERHTMEVNALRQLVDEVAVKKAEIGPIDIGISRSVLFQAGPLARLEVPQNPLGRRGTSCRACGVVVSSTHMPRHLALHRGELQPDQRSAAGGFFCDLCGLVFRQHFNLIKHWRTGCPEIQANLPENIELTLDDGQLRVMVADLLKRAITVEMDNLPGKKRLEYETISNPSNAGVITMDKNIGVAVDTGDGEHVIVDGDGFVQEELEIAGGTVSHNQAQASAWDGVDQGVVYADDFGDEEDMIVLGEDGNIALANQANRDKWKVAGPGVGVQCPECFRSFANVGRLERHLAGFHASFGSHHCVLCGNRFKYDYNLLYHYRRSCPYTKAFIDRDVREQMDAQSLRKLVRQLAQKEVRLTPQMKPETLRLMNLRKGVAQSDVRSRKEMMKHPAAQAPPPQLLQARAGLTDARACPICAIVFYGKTAVDRHVQAAHGMLDADEARGFQEDHQAQLRGEEPEPEFVPHEVTIPEEEEGPIEPPPQLERQEPAQVALIDVASTSQEHTNSSMRFMDQNGDAIVGLNGADMAEVQHMIEDGSMAVGDQIVIVENGMEVAYQVASVDLSAQPTTVVLVPAEEDQYQGENEPTSSAEHRSQSNDHIQKELEDFGGTLLEEERQIESADHGEFAHGVDDQNKEVFVPPDLEDRKVYEPGMEGDERKPTKRTAVDEVFEGNEPPAKSSCL